MTLLNFIAIINSGIIKSVAQPKDWEIDDIKFDNGISIIKVHNVKTKVKSELRLF